MDKISLTLKKIPELLDARFKANLLDDNLLEIENEHGLPKTIYVNNKGEIWSSEADGVSQSKSPESAAKEIRSIVSRTAQNSFKISDMFKMLPGEQQQHIDRNKPHMQLDEGQIVNQGSDITKDVLQEPEISSLNLSPEDQNQVAIMVFDVLLNDKNQDLNNLPIHAASKLASKLNDIFQNMTFVNNGDEIQVFFDAKIAGTQKISKEQTTEVLKYALSDLNLVNLYNEIVADYIKKISSKEPNYFKLRDIIISEVLEQINGK